MPISMTQGSNKYYLHYDQVGSLRAVSDINHNVIKEITYDTYGNIISDSNESFKVPFGFAGGLYDEDTKLNRFGYRDYDSYTGKWTAKDPIDFDGGDSNLYGYVLNDLVNFIDPYGLMDVSSGIGVGGGVHIGVIGVNHHIDSEGNQTTCIRVGLGLFIGGGAEGYINSKWNDNNSSDECKKTNSKKESWTLGIGGDFGIGDLKLGGSVGVGPDGGSLTGGVPLANEGVGISGGVEYCYSR